MGSSSGQSGGSYDLSFKILLIGDSGVRKSSLRVGFISSSVEDLAPTIEGGMALAKELGCLFVECSAITRENVERCFEELALKIMEIPSLLEEGSNVDRNI